VRARYGSSRIDSNLDLSEFEWRVNLKQKLRAEGKELVLIDEVMRAIKYGMNPVQDESAPAEHDFQEGDAVVREDEFDSDDESSSASDFSDA